MKTIESRIAPNPKEAQIWIDLSANAHGLVKKYWNGSKWDVKEQSDSFEKEDITKMFEQLFKDIKDSFADITARIDFLSTYHDEYVLKLIKELANRISKLEEFIITE